MAGNHPPYPSYPYPPPPPGPFAYAPSPGFLGYFARRLHTVAIAWIVYAGLIAVTGLAGLAFAHAWMGHGWFGHPWFGSWHHSHNFGPWDDDWNQHNFAMPFFWHFAEGAILLRAALAAAAGIGLLQKAPWGRWVAIIAAVLALPHPILGTALGICTLIVLLNRANTYAYETLSNQ